MKKNFALAGIVFASLIFVLAQSAYATDPVSCVFAGNVAINDNPVAGELVSAYLNDTTTLVGDGKNGTSEGIYSVVITNADDQYVFFRVSGILADQDAQMCTGGMFPPIEFNLTVTDMDNDGYGQKEDCNDTNPYAHDSNADEVCDGYDNNCNDVADDGTYYCDADHDDYYSEIATGCIPSGVNCVTTQGDDCRDVGDNAANYHPGANDVCDGADTNCDGGDNGCVSGGGGGGGGATAYCGDNILQKYRGEECEENSDCNATYVCNASCMCVLCTEDWNCTEWGACSQEGVQTRTCTDANACGTTNEKPKESQTCTYTSGGASTTITPLGTAQCGNGECENGETCDNCPEDCGVCGAGAGALVGAPSGAGLIGMIMSAPGAAALGLLIIVLLAVLVLLATRRRKKK